MWYKVVYGFCYVFVSLQYPVVKLPLIFTEMRMTHSNVLYILLNFVSRSFRQTGYHNALNFWSIKLSFYTDSFQYLFSIKNICSYDRFQISTYGMNYGTGELQLVTIYKFAFNIVDKIFLIHRCCRNVFEASDNKDKIENEFSNSMISYFPCTIQNQQLQVSEDWKYSLVAFFCDAI